MISENPARLLLEQFDEWTVPAGQTVRTARAQEDEENGVFWARQVAAVEWVRDIGSVLDAMELAGRKVSASRKHLPAWYAAVFSYEHGWVTTVNGEYPALNHEAARDVLEHLAETLEGSPFLPHYETAELDEIHAAAGELRDLVGAASWLDVETRAHVERLIRDIVAAVQEGSLVTAVGLRSRTTELAGVATSLGARDGDIPAEERRQFFAAGVKLLKAGGSTAYTTSVTILTTGAWLHIAGALPGGK